ncbi:MAG: PEP-CTERM sorting domain-containing protein [Planctomycetota bacterium]
MRTLRAALLCIAIFTPIATSASATEVIEIDLAGWETFGDFTNPNNTSITLDLLPNGQIVSVEWIDLEFTTEGGSWQSEFVFSVNDSANTGAAGTFWDFAPAPGVDFEGTYSGSGSFNDVDSEFGSGPFTLLPDGQVTVFIYETFDDPDGTGIDVRDALVTQGTLRITAVPEPSSLAFLGCMAGGVVWRRRRNRS